MKSFVAKAIGHYEVLVKHSQRPYEPYPPHVLKRMVMPLCRDLTKLLTEGTKNDAWEAIEGFSAACKRLTQDIEE